LFQQRRRVQRLPNQPPSRQVTLHQRVEAVVVMAHEEMHQFVDDEVLDEALWRLLHQLEVQPDAASLWRFISHDG
jgi:hypothetical protein